MTKERAAALAAHDHFARYGPEPWDELRAALGDKPTDNLMDFFVSKRVAVLQVEATDAVAVADKAAAGEWDLQEAVALEVGDAEMVR